MMAIESLTLARAGRCILTGLNLSLVPGEVLAVLGPNGAGKSSLLAALSGELQPAAGQVRLGGRALSAWPDEARARQLAVLPQTPALSFGFTTAEVVALGRLPHATGRVRDVALIEEAMAWADVSHLAARDYLSLSGGERQRVQMARVLAQLLPGDAGQVLLLDEPTAMLDPPHQHGCLQRLRRLAAQGVAVLVILHDLNLAARYADRLLLLAGGRQQALGPVAEVLTEPLLASVFDLPMRVVRLPDCDYPLVMAR